MRLPSHPELAPDEIDDLLYFTRVNEIADLRQVLDEAAQKYGCRPGAILKSTIDPQSGNTAFHYCAANGFADLLPTLLAYIKDDEAATTTTTAGEAQVGEPFVDQKNDQGNTALHWAALNGHVAIVRQLIEAGASMWVKNAAGHLALFEAERAEKGEVVQYLLEAGGKEVERTGNEREEDVAEGQGGIVEGVGEMG